MTYINPVPGAPVSSEFGYRPVFGDNHLGIDLAASEGTQVKATKAGTVNWVQYWDGWSKSGNQSYGNVVRIDHGDGNTSLYAHLSRIDVQRGQWVEQGQVIGAVGNTGNSFGAHLHFEIAAFPNVIRYNPRDFIDFEARNQKEEKKKEEIKMRPEVVQWLENLYDRTHNDEVQDWAKNEMDEIVDMGITTGERPNDFSTRTETAIMIKRAFDKVNK